MSSFKNENKKVSPRSLPESMCCLDRDDALDKARALTRFLQDAVECMATEEMLNKGNVYGAYQCFALLNDLQAIAAGKYRFPMVGTPEDEKLCHREEEDHDWYK